MSQNITNQSGAALVVSMIILLAMTVLAVTSMKSTTTELAMAGNLRESAITFQAAEVGLKTAEGLLEAENEPANLIAETDVDPDYLVDTTWNSAAASTASVTLPNITQNPQYIIKYLGRWDPDAQVTKGDPGFGGYGQTSTSVKIDYFRPTARGYGQSGNTYRTVQSFFGRRSK